MRGHSQVTCRSRGRYFFDGSPEGSPATQRIALGWQAMPVLEQIGASPSAPRVQLTHSFVHRAQFGGPFCIETAAEDRAGGISSSVARRLAAIVANDIERATVRAKCRMPLSARRQGSHGANYRHSTLVIS